MRRASTLLFQALLAVSLLLFLTRSQTSSPAPVVDPALLLRKQRRAATHRQAVVDGTSDLLPGVAVTPPEHAATAATAATAGSTASPDDTLVGKGQCEHARLSVQTAIEQQREPKEGALWQNTQSSYDQVERESDNVRRLLQADGMPTWQPDLSKLPPPRPANASMLQLLEHVPVGGHAWLAFGNSGVTEMIFNWCHHVIRLGLGWQLVVAAFDVPLLLALRERRIPAYNYSGALPATHFRHAPHLFHRMGFLKAELIVHVLRTGRHALVSDSDVAWVASPLPLLDELLRLGATMGSSTDCLDTQSDADKTPRKRSAYMCGYSPGNEVSSDVVFNTGVVWFRAEPSAIEFAREWALGTLALTDPFSDDQGVFNRLLLRGMFPVVAHSNDGRVIRARGSLRVAPLPASRFCSGHLVWVQQAARPHRCLSVHATFTEYGDAGKRWRFLEAGLWGLLPEAYYTEGRYLTFKPPTAPPDPQPCATGQGVYITGEAPQPCGGVDPSYTWVGPRLGNIMGDEAFRRSSRLRANVELMRRQVHALRDALAIARVLNRTLVLPHFDCLCDRSEDVFVIPTCVHHGAPPSLPMPFKCSQHFVADTHKLQLMATEPTRFGMQPHKFGGLFTRPLPLRAHSFLDDPRTAAAIREGLVEVAVGGEDLSLAPAQGLRLPRGATNVVVLRQLGELEAHRDARVLRLSDAEGAFGGWETDKQQATLFSTMMQYYLHRGAWCCSSRLNGNEDGRVYTKDPPPLKIPR